MECLEIPVLTLTSFPFQPKQAHIAIKLLTRHSETSQARGVNKDDQTPFGKLKN